jgi:hypothetical protein
LQAATAAMVGVAQLAERQVVVLDVVGSNPIVHPSVMSRDIEDTPNPRQGSGFLCLGGLAGVGLAGCPVGW